jgi:RNA polymerase sigma factor for flagellar operon FliA
VDHLDLVERVVRFVARRHRLSAVDAEEFASIVKFKLIDRDFAVLRKFEGRSNIATYLTTVIERHYLDFCIARWGKWRPSAAARRLGPIGVLLEQLMSRDGLSFDEAVAILQHNHQCDQSRDQFAAMLAQLPIRPVRRFAAEEELAAVAAHVGASDRALDRPDDQQIADRVERALTSAMATLPPLERLLLKLRFEDGCSIPAIARMLNVPAKPLYRQVHDAISVLRQRLDQHGIDEKDVERVVGHPAITFSRVFERSRDADSGELDDRSV